MVSDLNFMQMVHITTVRLNPCCNGIWSLTHGQVNPMVMEMVTVLILVVMEYGL